MNGPMANPVTLRWTAGWKYRVVDSVCWKLLGDFNPSGPYRTEYWQLFEWKGDWYVMAKGGCCWDGPTWFPDVEWMMFPSLIHDILHWVIAAGVIPEDSNDKIDAELAGIVRLQGGRMSGLRAWYIEKATNTVDQQKGETKEIFALELDLGDEQ
jgi:hypothetical protein